MFEAALLSIELYAFIQLLLAVRRVQHRSKNEDLGLFTYVDSLSDQQAKKDDDRKVKRSHA